MTKVFIDGSAGTTGLRIAERLEAMNGIELLTLPDELRKDAEARKSALNSADIAFICLPDDAAREAVGLIENENVRIIDTSTAHRTEPGWTYGMPELSGMRERIKNSNRIANPGCHASGFIALVAPLVESGLIKSSAELTCGSITGYSGGGRKMIAEYESSNRSHLFDAPRMYGIGQEHKHLKEMRTVCGLENEPIFCPTVSPFYSGMLVTVPLFESQIDGGRDDIKRVYRDYYRDGLIKYSDGAFPEGFISACAMEGRDDMMITVAGNEKRILLAAVFDNLGKGASGAAIQNMNILLGRDEKTGLEV